MTSFRFSVLVVTLLLAVPALQRGLAVDPPAAPARPYVPPRTYMCLKTAGPIRVDGKLDDAAWQAAPWTDAFVDIEGDRKPAPRFRTRARMLWDDQYFYIAAEMQEPHVWGTLTQHDAVIFHDNDFEVFIDPNGDNHEYYEFELNALNTGWDLFLPRPYKDGGKAMNAWEIPGLKTGVWVDGTLNDPRDIDRGWTVEIAFPWAVLGEQAGRPAPPKDGEQWRVNFSRVEWQHQIVDGKYRKVPNTREDNWVWSPQGVIDMHRPETWGYVQFSTATTGSRQVAPDPAGPARHRLHQIYYAQRDFRKAHGRWARHLTELSLPPLKGGAGFEDEELSATESLFEVRVRIPSKDGKKQTWFIRQDALLWHD